MYDPLEELDYEEGRVGGEGAAGDADAGGEQQRWPFTVYAYKRKTHSLMTSK